MCEQAYERSCKIFQIKFAFANFASRVIRGKSNPHDMPYNYKVRVLNLLRLMTSVPAHTLREATNQNYKKYIHDLRTDHGLIITHKRLNGVGYYNLVVDNTAVRIVNCESGTQRVQNFDSKGNRRCADGRLWVMPTFKKKEKKEEKGMELTKTQCFILAAL